MKKILPLFLTIILVLGLSACSNQEINNSNSDPNTPITNQNNSNLSGEDSSLTDNLEYAPILKNVSGESYVNLSNTYQLQTKPNPNMLGKLFKTDEEILPTKLYMTDINKEIFYKSSNGIDYSIPIEKCDDSKDERIVFSDCNIEFYLNIPYIKVNDSLIKNGDYDNERYLGIMNSYLPNEIIYRTNIDDDPDTIEYLIRYDVYDPGGNTKSGKEVIIVNNLTGQIKEAGILVNVCGNISPYKNVFFVGEFARGINLSNFFDEYLVLSYYIYNDTTKKFEEVDNKLANGDNWFETSSNDYFYSINEETISKLKEYPFTLNQDVGIVKSEGNYYKTKYELNFDSLIPSDLTLTKGTKLYIVDILDSYGNAICKTEDGKLTFYVDEGTFTGEPIEPEYFGCGGVAEIAELQRKLITLAKNGYRHHTSVGKGHMADILREAFTTYLDYDMIEL